MLSKISSFEGFHANITLDLNFWAMPFNMIPKLSSGHTLEFLKVANIATVFRALVVLRMLLKLCDSHPFNFTSWAFIALMRELTEINTVSYNWVNFLENVSFTLAMWASHDIVSLLLSIEVKSVLIIFARCRGFSLKPLLSLASSCGWRSLEFLTILFNHSLNDVLVFTNVLSRAFLHFNLAILAEDFKAILAFKRHEWELSASIA